MMPAIVGFMPLLDRRLNIAIKSGTAAKVERRLPKQLIGFLMRPRSPRPRKSLLALIDADQVERDYATFVKAVRSGRLKSDLSPIRLATAL